MRKNPENQRERYLTPEEVDRLLTDLTASPYQSSANAIRLLILTGARRNEVLGAMWAEFDLAAGIWAKPASRTKQGKLHRVPLSVAAIQLLVDMKATAEGDAESGQRAFDQLNEAILAMQDPEFRDIYVKPFRHDENSDE